jgi:hypothetical protein
MDQRQPHTGGRQTHGSADGDTTGLFFRSLVDLGVVHKLATSLLGEVLGDGGSERGLSVVYVL